MSRVTKPRLRFDKVALRLTREVQHGLRHDVAANTTVMFAVAAPIRVASKTAAMLIDIIRDAVRRDTRSDVQKSIHGNAVRIRIVRIGHARAKNVLGFVYTPRPGAAEVVLDDAQARLILAG